MPNYDPEIDRLGFPELSSTLANTIRNNAAHTKNNDIHVTNQDKILWNTVSDLPEVTHLKKGYMSKEDKIKLDGIEKGANNYAHPKSDCSFPIVCLHLLVESFDSFQTKV